MSFGFGFGFTKITAAIRAAFSPASLFANNEPGVWYDPSDFSTMFQDAAGTVPVTAVEQPVGRILDKSGRGFHATQATATSRPVLSARVNLLTKTEQFNDVAWLKMGTTVMPNAAIAPDGTLTAERLTATGTNSNVHQGVTVTASIAYKFSAAVLKGTSFTLAVDNKSNVGRGVSFDGVTGEFITFNTLGNGYVVSEYSCVTHPSNPDYWLAFIVITPNDAAINASVWINTSESSGYVTKTSTPGDTLTIWGASLVPADQARLPYQRVNTATDYDTAGFPHYLYFDGVDNFLVTPTITPGIDKVQVFAGVRYLSAINGIVLEHGNASNGRFSIWSAASQLFFFDSCGSGDGATTRSASVAVMYPATVAGTAESDISAPFVRCRVNSGSYSTNTVAQGTGNYLAYPLFIGRRGGTSFPFNGHLYSLIVRFGSNLPIETIEQAEAWINSKTGAY